MLAKNFTFKNVFLFSWVLISLCLFFVFTPKVEAANVYIDPPTGTFVRGETYSAKIRIDTEEGECINAVHATLSFTRDAVRLVDFSRGESIISLWVEDPLIEQNSGTFSFSGGLPGGYCGRIDGDPELTNVLGELIFQSPGFVVGSPDIDEVTLTFLDDTEVLLNDGFGTKTTLSLGGAEYSLGEESTFSTNWLELLRGDGIRPEPFSLELIQDDSVFKGDYFIAFSTSDKQTGIDHYEVLETDIEREGFIRGSKKESFWRNAVSPYVLEDQSLNSVIRVRAYDKAGNIRIAGLIPDESLRKRGFFLPLSLPILGGAVIVIIILLSLLFLLHKKAELKRNEGAAEGARDDSSEENNENIEMGETPSNSSSSNE